MKEVPCIRLDHLTDKERSEYAIMHNKTAELSEWDMTMLTDELTDLDISDFDVTFDGKDVETLTAKEEAIVEDIPPEIDDVETTSNIDIHSMKKDELVSLLEKILSEDVPTDVIHEDKPTRNDIHPTMKPVRLIARQIRNSSRKGEAVLDIFGGSGTTMIACEQLGRDCYMCELDPRYADAIITRWENLTGEKAEKINQ